MCVQGKRWWLGAEDPWQCLASCVELVQALRSENPEGYISHLPVHQDGTCNGLQHYAALGGDVDGAIQVNLLPSERPQDVYSGVARLVIKAVEKDAEEKNIPAAKILAGRITRKVIKQTVMTNVYGVTFVGAREQIENRIKELPGIDDDIAKVNAEAEEKVRAQAELTGQVPEYAPRMTPYNISLYLTGKVFDSLGQMFNGAQKIQAWLNESARRIAKSVPPEVIKENQKTKTVKRTAHNDTCTLPEGAIRLNANMKRAMIALDTRLRRQSCFKSLPKLARNEAARELRLALRYLMDKNRDAGLRVISADLADDDRLAVLKGLYKAQYSGAVDSSAKTALSRSSRRSSPNRNAVQQLTSVIWTTPLNLPIVQPYRKMTGRVIRTALQVVTINDPDVISQVNVQRQRTAFPPNYIHSLDATHMLYSAVACKQRDLTFAAVHDSYWTHAADVDTMNAILRERFIHMHSKPLMENLYNEFVERYRGYKVPASVYLDAKVDDKVQGMDPEMEEEEEVMSSLPDEGEPSEEMGADKKSKSSASPVSKNAWVDLVFDPLPPRGTFNVNQVQKSTYFFH